MHAGRAGRARRAGGVNNSRAGSFVAVRALRRGVRRPMAIIGPMRRLWLLAVVLGVWVAGCAPAFDWRTVRTPDDDVELQFPCKPTSRTRAVALGGASVTMTLVSCTVQGVTFGLAHADLDDPARVTPVLAALRAALAANLGAQASRSGAFTPKGATPNDAAVRVRLAGRSGEGAAIEAEAAFFARGMRVYQATVLGAELPAPVIDVFFDSLRLGA